MRKSVRISIWIASFLGILVLLGFVRKSRTETTCKKVDIHVDSKNGMFFLSEKGVREYMKDQKDTLVGRKMESIDINELEESLELIPEVKDAEVFRYIDGTVRIEMTQRQPTVRILSASGASFYLDREGKKMPLSANFTPRVLIINGVKLKDEKKGKEKEKLDRIHQLSLTIHEDSFWKAQIQEIYWNERGNIEMVPRVGDHRIMFGELEKVDEKLKKLKAFYKEGLNHTGWAKYDTIDLKYEGQVVCKK